MARWFNVAGPCRPDVHYMLPATARLPSVLGLVARQHYFVLHAPRQTGKTTAMLSLAHALALIGLRDVRDYKVASGGSGRLSTASPFNIKVESLTLRDFTADEVATLYMQHTTDTGQVFLPDAVARAFALTQGQPWLVNALARQAVEVIAPNLATPITVAHIDQARDHLITRQDTHLDSLAERLREPRVRAVIEPILAGSVPPELNADDVQFVQDLGLVRMDSQAGLVIANPIYAEVIPRTLTTTTRAFLPALTPSWLTADKRLDPARLLEAFLSFWRQHGQPLLGTTAYHKIAPHLVLLAFLDRVANGGGRVERETAVGRGRLDLRLEYGDVVLPMEVKVWRDGQTDPQAEGLAQLDGYMQGLGVSVGWLIIFDQRTGQLPIATRTTTSTVTSVSEHTVTVIRA